jgi:hypothetical protein
MGRAGSAQQLDDCIQYLLPGPIDRLSTHHFGLCEGTVFVDLHRFLEVMECDFDGLEDLGISHKLLWSVYVLLPLYVRITPLLHSNNP